MEMVELSFRKFFKELKSVFSFHKLNDFNHFEKKSAKISLWLIANFLTLFYWILLLGTIIYLI